MHSNPLIQVVYTCLEDLKAQNIVELDVSSLSSVTDTLIIASGNSSRQVIAMGRKLVEAAKEANLNILGVEGLDAGDWVLVDLGDVLVHLMQPATREFYDLEKLWGNACQPAAVDAFSTNSVS